MLGGELIEVLAIARVPDADGLVETARGDGLAVGEELEIVDDHSVPLQLAADHFAGLDVPDPDGFVVGSRHYALPVAGDIH